MEKLLEAIANNADAITFWETYDTIIPATATIIKENNETEHNKTEQDERRKI